MALMDEAVWRGKIYSGGWVDGGGGDIFRDLQRMNAILASPAHVRKMDVLLSNQVFTW